MSHTNTRVVQGSTTPDRTPIIVVLDGELVEVPAYAARVLAAVITDTDPTPPYGVPRLWEEAS